MEDHPLLKELLEICEAHDVDVANAYTVFDVFFELTEVRKLADLKYHFHEKLKKFYVSGKKEKSDDTPDIYVPVMSDDKISPEEISIIQENLCPDGKRIFLFIRDRDSSSTCYCIKKGLAMPESPESCKKRKELEVKKYHFEKSIQSNRKFFYTKALRNSQSDQTMESEDEKS